MADIFVSYSSSDRAWAFWIGKELQKLGHTPLIHEWEITFGNVARWMNGRFDQADHALCVVSATYLTRDYSNWERQAAEWAAVSEKPDFVQVVVVEPCKVPRLLAPFRRCDLHGLDEDAARAALADYLRERAWPVDAPFPGTAKAGQPAPQIPDAVPFPGKPVEPAAPQAAASAPSPATPTSGPTTPFPPDPEMIGREDRRRELVDLLLSDNKPVIVPGGPGMGKTTLALAAAHHPRVVERFGARRVFVLLDAVPGADGILRHLATDLGLLATGAAAEIEAGIASACAAQPTLAILDNFETPFSKDGRASEALLARLAAMTGLRLVVTVRGQPPKIPGRAARTLMDIERLTPDDAEALFLRHAGDQFAGDPAIPTLVAALDGHPLSIELFAANAAGGTNLRGVLDDWRARRRDLLQAGAADDRLTSLRVSLGLSLDALGAASAPHRLIRAMAMLPDGMSDADSQTLLTDGESGRDERAAALRLETARLASRVDGRWRLLAPIRETLVAHYPPKAEDLDRLIRRFLGHAADGGTMGSSAWGAVKHEVLAESGNLDAMLATAIRLSWPSREIGDAAVGLAKLHAGTGLGSAASLPDARGRLHEGGDILGEANCIVSLGNIALARSDHDGARRRYEEALPLYRQVGSVLGEANCTMSLGEIALRRSDHDGARQRYEEALPLYRQVGSALGEANCIKSLGDIALRRSDHDGARKRYEEALPFFRQVGDVLGEANCIRSLGEIDEANGELGAARVRWREALALYARIPEPYSIGWTHLRLARIAAAPEDAAAHREAARKAWASIGRQDLINGHLGGG